MNYTNYELYPILRSYPQSTRRGSLMLEDFFLTLIFGALQDARIFSLGYHGGEVLTHQSTLSSKATN